MPTVTCADCGREKLHRGRGLCQGCYSYYHKRGRLAGWPRRLWHTEDLIEEYQFLTSQGMSYADVAERLGVTRKALNHAVRRAREYGLLEVD